MRDSAMIGILGFSNTFQPKVIVSCRLLPEEASVQKLLSA